MMQPLVLVHEEEPAIAVVSLNRAEKRNALSVELLTELDYALGVVRQDRSLRVLLVRGVGPMFCSGMDLNEANDPEVATLCGNLIARTLQALAEMPIVTIALVQGAALGGGAGLLSACDLAVVAEDAVVGYPEVRRGLTASMAATLLRRQLPERLIRELLLLGEPISADRAFRMGLINKVAAADQLLEEGLRLGRLALQGAPGAIAETKRMLAEIHPVELSSELQRGLAHLTHVRALGEAKEGLSSFAEKRAPNWQTISREL